SWWRNVKRLFACRRSTLAALPEMKLSTQRTSCPSARKRSHRCEPIKPAPPVINVRMPQILRRSYQQKLSALSYQPSALSYQPSAISEGCKSVVGGKREPRPTHPLSQVADG